MSSVVEVIVDNVAVLIDADFYEVFIQYKWKAYGRDSKKYIYYNTTNAKRNGSKRIYLHKLEPTFKLTTCYHV